MALVLKDRVQETTTTTGTGTITLAGAVSGFQSFSAVGNGNTCYYAIVGETEWEVGFGTYTSSGTTLSRSTILESSNGGTAVNFSAGTKNVFVTYPAEKGIYLDDSGNAIGLGTPATVTLTNATGLPISTGITGLGSNVATFLATPSSANLSSAVTDETGSGSLVFATLPTFGGTGVKFSGSTSGTTTVLATATAGTTTLTLPAATDTLVGKATTDTFTNKTLTGTKETVFTITDGAAFEIDPANGGIQVITLGASRTPKGTNFTAGQSVTLMVNDGTAYTITWTDATFGTGGVIWVGGTAPTLATTGYTVIELWKVSTQVYGALVGNVA
jgi:hypothetical protein